MGSPNIVTSPKTKLEPLRPGARTDCNGKPVKNILLLAIPDREYNLLRPYLEVVDLNHHEILHEQGEKIEAVYFPNDGMVSLVVTTNDGRSVEVGLVGREGFIGTPLAVGLRHGPYRAIVQISGSCARIKASILAGKIPLSPRFWMAMNRYILLQGLQMAQVAACNRLHELEERLSRWLLMCQDRVDLEVLNLTHEFLAQMLGTGRPSVSLAAGMLEKAGLIENVRGTVRICNRKKLEEVTCECYRVIQNFNGGLGLK